MRQIQLSLSILNEAKRTCLLSTVKRSKMCAFLMDGKRIFRKGYNRILLGNKNFTQHAEEHLLSKIKNPFGILMIFRYRPFSDTFGNSRPCSSCFSKILKTNISKLVYNVDGIFYEENLKEV